MIELEDNEEFEVDKIVAQRKNSEGVIEYKIRWKGFSSDFDTWEPELNLIGCEEVLREFKINNGLFENLKKDFEDGEVSESESDDSEIIGGTNRRIKKTSKGKKKKSKKRNSDKSENSNVKGEVQAPPDTEGFNEEFGIKVEIAVDPKLVEKNKPQSFTPNFSMGASELLLNYYSIPVTTTMGLEPDFKHEVLDLTDDVVIIKEEKGCSEYLEDPQSDDVEDSDSDLDGQLKVVINDEQDDIAQDKCIDGDQESSSNSNDKTRSWRDKLDTGNFKIRKSTFRKDDVCQLDNGETSTPILAKDKWTNFNIKDNQAEAFYNLPVMQSLQEVRLRVDKDIMAIKTGAQTVSKEDIVKAIEEGNSGPIWSALLCNDSSLNDGDLLILASKMGYSDIIGMIIRAGVDVNYQNDEGVTPLMTACEYGHELVCHLLIMNGAHINFTNKKSESALLKVVTRGQKECLLVLLQYGCDVFSLDNEKSVLQIARQRNLHEIEALITDYHKKLSDSLNTRLLTLMDDSVTVNSILFPLRILSLYEENDFVLDFNVKLQPVKDDECNLLMIFTGFVQDKQIKFCFEQTTQITSVVLNEIEQQSLIPDNKNYAMSMSPILDNKNVLNIKCQSKVNCRWVRRTVLLFPLFILDVPIVPGSITGYWI